MWAFLRQAYTSALKINNISSLPFTTCAAVDSKFINSSFVKTYVAVDSKSDVPYEIKNKQSWHDKIRKQIDILIKPVYFRTIHFKTFDISDRISMKRGRWHFKKNRNEAQLDVQSVVTFWKMILVTSLFHCCVVNQGVQCLSTMSDALSEILVLIGSDM